MKRTGASDAYARWNRELPVLLMSGEADPVGDAGKGVRCVEQRMKQAGLKNVIMYLLPDARHDLLHEESSGSVACARSILMDWLTGNNRK